VLTYVANILQFPRYTATNYQMKIFIPHLYLN